MKVVRIVIKHTHTHTHFPTIAQRMNLRERRRQAVPSVRDEGGLYPAPSGAGGKGVDMFETWKVDVSRDGFAAVTGDRGKALGQPLFLDKGRALPLMGTRGGG